MMTFFSNTDKSQLSVCNYADFNKIFEVLNNFDVSKSEDYDSILNMIKNFLINSNQSKDCFNYICFALLMFHGHIATMISQSETFTYSSFLDIIKENIKESNCEKGIREEIIKRYSNYYDSNCLQSKNKCQDSQLDIDDYGFNDIEIVGENAFGESDDMFGFNTPKNEFISFKKEEKPINKNTITNSQQFEVKEEENESLFESGDEEIDTTIPKKDLFDVKKEKEEPKDKIECSDKNQTEKKSSLYDSVQFHAYPIRTFIIENPEKERCNNVFSSTKELEHSKQNFSIISDNESNKSNSLTIANKVETTPKGSVLITTANLKTSTGEGKIKSIDDLINKVNEYKTICDFIIASKKGNILPLHILFYGVQLKEINEDIENKAFTILAYIFPFLTEKQKQTDLHKIQEAIKGYPIISFLTNVFYINNETDRSKNYIVDLLDKTIQCNSFDVQSINEIIYKLKTFNDIKDLYILLMLYKGLHLERYQQNENNVELAFNNISFILIYIASQGSVEPEEKFINCFYDLYIIKVFLSNYQSTFKDTISLRENFFYFGNKRILKKEEIEINNYLQLLFDDSEINQSALTKKRIEYFYSFENIFKFQEINSNNISFMLRNNELEYFKNTVLFNMNNHTGASFKQNLIELEDELFNNARSKLGYASSDILDNFEIPSNIRDKFNQLDEELHSRFRDYYFNLYPFGSITQFLNVDNSDLDIYLEVDCDNARRIKFINSLAFYIKDNIDENYQNVNSNRICLLSFSYQGLKVDLSCIGLCPYLHSNILRTYAQMDARFSILAINIKLLIRKLELVNTEGNKVYLNSFCWMMLLITFLQDIISPPILPKLLVNANKTSIDIELGGKKRIDVGNNYYLKKKTIRMVLESTGVETMEISEDNFDNAPDIYVTTIEKENPMSLSELFIKFLEFVIFYFKQDSLFVSFSYNYEGILNRSQIKNLLSDSRFRDYYYNRFIINPKGDILFREPYDYNYNPGQTLTETKAFIDKLKQAYFCLLKYGSLSLIGNNYEEFEGDFC